MFKNRWITSSIVFFCGAILPVQAATFEVPKSFEIMYVDLDGARQYGNDFKISVEEGSHQIVVRFNRLLRSGGDTTVYQSEPIVLDVTFNKDDYFTLKAPYISKAKQAESYKKSPKFTILDKRSGKDVMYQQQILPTQSGLQNTRNYLSEIERLTKKTTSKVAAENLVFGDGPNAAPIIMRIEDIELNMMKFWYNESDEATRKAFRVWINDALYKSDMASVQFNMSQFWYKKADKNQRKAFQDWLTN